MKDTRLLSILALGISAALLSGCGESTSSNAGPDFGDKPVTPAPDNGNGFNQKALIANLADNVIAPTFAEFRQDAIAQQQAVNAYCQQETALAANNASAENVQTALTTAQNSWTKAIGVWQQAELMQVGPLLANDAQLRNSIYSWPTVSSCGVDFDVMFFKTGTVNGAPYDITKRTANRRGLDALEYLLFNKNLASSCTTAAPSGWDNLTDSEKKIARCNFAVEVAKDIKNSADTVVSSWTAHTALLKKAGESGSGFSSEHEAVNRFSDAMFYLDSTTKDIKLAYPLGIAEKNSCGAEACPQDVESKYAHQSIKHIINNLEAFERLLKGGEGIGFTDYLVNEGDQDTANIMLSDVQKAITSAKAYQTTLAQALENNSEQVTQTHAEVKKVTDKLKTDFINSLALTLPKTSAGDND
ncbi:peptidase M75 [Parashewanella curva]|uniref:Peptidase M75 n=1 Tax=Parashewanella curva TaxID=2338552 RepID=A0A3L8PY07_9GAMM|nr:imelysin family protein [Parashewanella curva]RLV60306.1 peptidase M75 [Parashewanella curva]